MADATTTNFADTKPEVGASEDSWGTKLNGNFDRYDDRDYRLLTTANYAANGGTADALTATLNPTWQSLAAGHRVYVKVAADNTAGVTLAVDSTGVKDVLNMDGSTLTAGTLKSGGVYGFVYDGTQYRLLDTPKATTAETLLGTSVAKAVTPAGLGGLNSTSSGVHVLKLANGYMIQAGRYSGGGSSASVTFPVAFTESPIVTLTTRSTGATTTSGTSGVDGQVGLAQLNGDPTTTGFSMYISTEGEVNDVFNACVSGRKVDWQAIGKVATS